MAAKEPEENQPLKSEASDNDATDNADEDNNKPDKAIQDPTPAAVGAVADPQSAKSAPSAPQEPGQQAERQKDAQDYVQEIGVVCNKCYNWFPIGLFGWIGGIVLVACCIVDIFITQLTFTQFFVIALLMCGGLIMILVEMPTKIVMTQRTLAVLQLALYEWMKLLSRMWGRGVFCIVLVVMCFSEISSGFSSLPWIAGIYFSALIVLYFIFGLLAAKKYNGLYVYISKTELKANIDVDLNVGIEDDENKEMKEEEQIEVPIISDDGGDLLRQKFAQKFDELDEDGDGRIGRKDIAKLGVEANLELSASECHAIVCYLDNDCNGEILKVDWVKMWMRNPRLIWM